MPDKKQQPKPKPKATERKPIVVTNPNDPRLKAYNDSLQLHNYGLQGEKYFKTNIEPLLRDANQNPSRKPELDDAAIRMWNGENKSSFFSQTEPKVQPTWDRLSKLNKKPPTPESKTVSAYDSWFGYNKYKKPVQPIVYQKPQQNQGKILNKEEFIKAYNKQTWDEWLKDNKSNLPVAGIKVDGFGDIQKLVYGERKDYPIREPLPKAQAKINITSPQQSMMPQPEEDYVYGPANSVIGTNINGKFTPINMPEQRGKVNQADWDMLNNQEDMKKYVKGKGLDYKCGGKIKGKKAAWGASLGTDPFVGGPGPVNPFPKGFKIPMLDANGNPIPESSTTIPVTGQSPTWENFSTTPGASTQPVSINPNRPKTIENRDYIPNQGEGQLNKGKTPNLTEGQQQNDKNAINPNQKPLSMPEGAGGGGFTGQGILAGLSMYSAFMGPDRKKRRYVRPEDMETYNQNQYGTGSQALSEYGNTLKGKKKEAFWGAVIGAVAGGKGGLKPIAGLHNNINEAMMPLMNVANEGTARAQYLDNTDFQNTANLQNPQQILPAQQQWAYMKNGGKMKYNNGGELMTGEGGNTQLKSYNPFDGGTFQFNGDSHGRGGIDISYKGEEAEVEGGETAFKDEEGNLKIMGNLVNPLTGRKYKDDLKKIAKKEQRAQKIIDKGTLLLNSANPDDAYEALAFNAGKVMALGGTMKQKELSGIKEHLGNMQEAHLEVAKEKKMSPEKLFKYGGEMYANGGTKGEDPKPKKKWVYKGTDVSSLDPKIKEFADLLAAKGIEGYSGERGGYRAGATTTSGRKSRHARKQALDLIPVDGQMAYNKILNDPELVSYLMSNNLTVIDEYAPDVAKKTGATAGHLHIGRDKGTTTADKFRRDVISLYPDLYSTETRYKANDDGKIYTKKSLMNDGYTESELKEKIKLGVFSVLPGITSQNYKEPALNKGVGDAQTENVPGWVNKPFNVPPMNYLPKPTEIQTVQGSDTPMDLKQPAPYNKPSNARGINPLQFLGEAYAIATNREEPVKAQLYTPELFQPYQVSFQDRLNENQSTFNSIQKQVAYDPTSLATLAGQKYSANSSVLADEFRTNQGIANDITNKNVALLNEAEKTNLGILDQQYVRQSQAKSNTKKINIDALSSVSSKMLQKEASNNQLRVYENLYQNYSFDPHTGKALFQGAKQGEEKAIDYGIQPLGTQSQGNRSKVVTKAGNTTSTQYYDDPIEQALKQNKLENEKLNRFKPVSFPNLFKIRG